jgi:uncharacterized integral membrane protein
MRLSTWVLLPPALVAGVALAVANRARVTVAFDPFTPSAPFYAVEAPLFLVMFACLLIGVLLGGLVAWMAGAATRRQVRLHARELRRLQAAEARLAPAAPDAAALPARGQDAA